MLVLSRKQNETVEFPALGVVIRVCELSGRRVQLGVEAPQSLWVTRGEKLRGDQPQESPQSVSEQALAEKLRGLEAELAALAELAAGEDREMARQVAADAIDRLAQIQRMLRAINRQNRGQPYSNEQPACKVIRFDRDVSRAGESDDQLCVRQTQAGYSIRSGESLSASQRACAV